MTQLAEQDALLASIDSVVDEPVVVLDPPSSDRAPRLLATHRSRAAIEELLTTSGYVAHGQRWARFSGSSVSGIELLSLDDWWPTEMPPGVLFDPADVLDGCCRLVAPRPAALLLLAARELVLHRGVLGPRLRARVSAAVAADPWAWGRAEVLSRRAGLSGALRLLRRAHGRSDPLPPSGRARGLVEAFLEPASSIGRWSLFHQAFLSRRRSTVVSFSGLDGAGKTTQMSHLRSVFDFFGMPTGFDHAVFASGWRLHFLSRLLGRFPSRGTSPDAPPPVHDPRMPVEFRATERRQRFWVFTVALVNVGKSWRRELAYRSSGRVVLVDRFTPDTAVKLDFYFGERWSLDVRRARTLFTRAAPKPDLGFLMAVPGAVAHARRGEWEPEELEAMARSYEEQVDRFGLVRLDGTQPPEVLQERVASTAWRRLR